MKLGRPSADTVMLMIVPMLACVLISLAESEVFSPVTSMVYTALLVSPVFWIVHRSHNPLPGRRSPYLSFTGHPSYPSVAFVALIFHRTGMEYAGTLEPGTEAFMRAVFTSVYFLTLILIFAHMIRGIWRLTARKDGEEPVTPPERMEGSL